MGSKRSDGGLPQKTLPAAKTGKSKDKVANAPVILGRSDDSDDDSAGENVRSTGLDSQPSVSVVLSKTKEKIACFTADQPRQQKKHKSQSTVSDANAGVDPERIFSQFH
ncbi:hypothetical protein Bca4012_052204 [Brassica carinata]|uniref:Uncharacterized protein n=1 Tax=Brassica carinata TaxID=52824 RepID=A0A8X7RB83_BRACI|nr:hypothetical protein Bca52824_054768 [Brassica carinata]